MRKVQRRTISSSSISKMRSLPDGRERVLLVSFRACGFAKPSGATSERLRHAGQSHAPPAELEKSEAGETSQPSRASRAKPQAKRAEEMLHCAH